MDVLLTVVKSVSKVVMYRLAHQYLSLLGLMTATLLVEKYAHIHMRPIQWYLKQARGYSILYL